MLFHKYCTFNKQDTSFPVLVSLLNSFSKEDKDEGPLAAKLKITENHAPLFLFVCFQTKQHFGLVAIMLVLYL